MITTRPVLTALIAGAVLVGGGGAAALLSTSGALASSSSPHPAPSHPAKAAPGPEGVPHLGPGMAGDGFLHGEFVVSKPGTSQVETFLVQNGSITSKTENSVTVKSSDGFSVTWAVTASTKIHGKARAAHLPKGAKPSPDAKPSPGVKPSPGAKPSPPAKESIADLAVGETVVVVGPKSGTGATAASISVRPEKPAAPKAAAVPAPKPSLQSRGRQP